MRRILPILALVLVAVGGLVYFLKRPEPRSFKPLPLDIWFTCDTSGRIEPCGCFSGQFGGLTRVSSAIANAPGAALKLEIGNALAGLEDYQILQFKHLLEAEAKLGYQALNLGSREASLPAATLESLAKASPVPLISANVLHAATREPVVEAFRVVNSGGLRVGLIGIVQSVNTQPHPSVIIEDPAETLRRIIPIAQEKSDVLVCMAFTDEAGLEKIARDFYELPILLGGDVRQPMSSVGRTNQSWIFATTNQARALAELHSTWDPKTKSLSPASGAISLMHDKIPEDPGIATFSKEYRNEVRNALLKVDADLPGAENSIPGVKPSATFVGSESCASCHPKTFASWQSSKHAHAFDSLVRKESEADPSCISCHTIGFGEPGGYRRSMKQEKLIHVGCESCHGPASEHIQARAVGGDVLQKMRPVGPGQCVQCHHGEFSRPFNYDAFWKFVQHGKE